MEPLRVFLAAARCGGFRQAALELNLTPGAIAHQVKKLESWLGFPLFQRLPRGVELNAAGRRYADVIGRLLEDIALATDGLRRDLQAEDLTVSAMPSFVTRWLMPRLLRLRKNRPELEVHVLATPEVTDFARDRVDVAVREGLGDYEGLVEEEILPEHWGPVCGPDYAARLGLREAADLLRATLLHDEPWPGTPQQVLWPAWLAACDCPETAARQNLHFSHSYLAIEAAIADQGVALANLPLVAEELRDGRLVSPVGPWLKGDYAFHLVAPKLALERPSVRDFWDWVTAEAAAQRRLIAATLEGRGANLAASLPLPSDAEVTQPAKGTEQTVKGV